MSSYDRVFVEVMPAARAMIAKKLISSYGYSQKSAAEKLGITQPAVSQYKRELRGSKTVIFSEHSELAVQVNDIAKKIAGGEVTMSDVVAELFDLCRVVYEKGKE